MDLSAIKKAGFYACADVRRGQPFPAGAGGCPNFRIPGLIRLKDGSLFAAVDARWTRPDDDAGGVDTAFAVSRDGGATWRGGYAAYFPDTLGSPADLFVSTTCLDPMPVQTPDGAVRIFVNLCPAGVGLPLNWPAAGNGFSKIGGKQRLMLTDDPAAIRTDPACFPYYVGEEQDGFYPVCTREGGPTPFSLDCYLNLYRGGEPLWQKQIETGAGIQQNVIYRDAALRVYDTSYTLMLTSFDCGESWSPRILSGEIKESWESAVIASPGNGLIASDGVAVLPFYSMFGGESHSFLVFSADNCRTFTRSPLLPSSERIPWSGECKPVELPNGRIRLFYRNPVSRICYADYDRQTGEWSESVRLPVLVHSECNFGALALDGAICIAYARGAGDGARNRSHGRVYRFVLTKENEMVLTDVLRAAEGAFSYAVLCEAGEGTLGLLYDTCGDGVVRFIKIRLPDEKPV